MKSGQPEPIDDLQLIIDTKRHAPNINVDVISDATRWLKAALDGADVKYSYASCEEGEPYGYAVLTIMRHYHSQLMILELKVAEINTQPHVFAKVRTTGKNPDTLFPFFGNLRSDEQRDSLLHYIADFVISSQA